MRTGDQHQDDKAKLNRYGEIASQICFGIEVNGHPLITKFQNYELKMMTQAERDALVQANVTELDDPEDLYIFDESDFENAQLEDSEGP